MKEKVKLIYEWGMSEWEEKNVKEKRKKKEEWS